MNNNFLTISKIYICLVLIFILNGISSVSLAQVQVPKGTNIQDLEKNIEAHLHYINKNKQDSIITISQFFYDLNLLNQLKFERHDSISTNLISKLDSTKSKDIIGINLIKNSIDLYLENFRIINKESFTDISLLFNKINKNITTSDICITIVSDIINHTDATKRIFTQPLNIENISEYYNIDINILSTLCEDKSAPSKTNKVTVKKGYSPFSNEYQNFIVFADSINKEETDIQKTIETSSLSKEDEIQQNPTYYSNNNKNSNSILVSDLIKKFDKESLIRYWKMYQNQDTGIQQLTTYSINSNDTLTPALNKVTIASNISQSDSTPSRLLTKQIQEPTLILDNTIQQPQETLEPSIKSEYSSPEKVTISSISTENDNNTYYFVQIAASRTPISESLLRTIYIGNDSIIIKQEEGWYKYQIGKTTNYSSAQNIAKTVRVAGAFVTAYKNNKKQILWKTLSSSYPSNESSKLIFVVQISANLKPINLEQRAILQKKVGGFIREINEDGWYKYQYVVGSSYKEALNKWKEIGTNISFLVAYYDGQKISIADAIKKYNEN